MRLRFPANSQEDLRRISREGWTSIFEAKASCQFHRAAILITRDEGDWDSTFLSSYNATQFVTNAIDSG